MIRCLKDSVIGIALSPNLVLFTVFNCRLSLKGVEKNMNLRQSLLSTSARLTLASLGIAALTLAGVGVARAQSTPSGQDFVNAANDTDNWILPAKNYSNNRYVTATQISPDSVGKLKPAWTFKLDDDGPTETSPIVWHGTMYVTSAHDHVYALDAKTGALKWSFKDNPHVISFAANRGVALMDGKVFLGTLDGHLIALDADSGKKVWDKVTVHDTANSFYTMAPIPYHNPTTGQDMLIENVADGDWGGIGNVTAFDPKDGHRLWEWNTVPGPGEPGHNSWSGESWKRGGAAAWGGIAIDPSTQMAYLDLGNPQPDFLGTVRVGANLYSDSMVALDISGAKPKLKWYHQFIAHDTHDWDPAMAPVLFKGKVGGEEKLMAAAGDKAGNFFILDAANGKLVDHTIVSFQKGMNSEPSLTGNVACPNTNGGVEYNGGTYDPATNTFFVPSENECGLWKSTKQAVYIAGQFYLGGAFASYVGPNSGEFNAISVDSGVFNWRHHYDLPMAGGALVTQTGLVFTGELNGNFDAFDTKTGKQMWQYNTGSRIIAPPMAYTQDGREYVVVASGRVGNQKVPELTTPPQGSMITAFAVAE